MIRRALSVALTVSAMAAGVPPVSGADSAIVATRIGDASLATLRLNPVSARTAVQSPFSFDEVGPGEMSSAVATADIQATYNGFDAASQAAFEYAVTIWERLIYSPRVIHVNATWTPLAPGVLGSAGSNFLWVSGGKVWTKALLEATCNCPVGADQSAGGAHYHEITANFSSAFSDWYLGTDANPGPTQIDFVSVVLHELGHGLGVSSSGFNYSGGSGSWGFGGSPSYTTNYGLALYSASSGGTQLMNTANYANPSAALGSALTSNSVYWEGTNVAALGGGRARMYAPSTWAGGSSIHHLDETTYAAGNINSLMTPLINYDEAIHNPGPITMAILRDIGWDAEGCSTAPFNDVANTHPFCLEIKWMKDNNISTGFAGNLYKPADTVTRQAMSAFLARLAGTATPACSVAPFSDVPTGHPFCKEIRWMADNAISTGFASGCGAFSPPCYKPDDPVTRQAMSAFLARLAGVAAGLPACSASPFSDVGTGHPFCKEIKWMKDTGISTGFTSGCGAFAAPCYLPGNIVTRQAMSAFLFRANSQL